MGSMAGRKLAEYENKRSFEQTPEPRGGKKPKRTRKAKGNRFVVHEHHARRLHWDLRLERDGVLASWALPKGVPQDPKENRLAVRTEDHPLEYLDFEAEIPKGQYGAGRLEIWDRGTYEAEKLRDDELIVSFAGERVKGKYALFQTKGDNWMIHRMDPPLDPERQPMPRSLKPMLATLSTSLPRDEDAWAHEIKWDGVRALAYCEGGGLRLYSRTLREITSHYPELRALGPELGSTDAVLDGEVVAFDDHGKPSFERLQSRMNLSSEGAIRRRMAELPVTYLIFDLLYLDGRSLIDLPYVERRESLDALELDGPSWQTPRSHRGQGEALLRLTKERGLEGLVAKRLDSRYLPGRRSRAWLKVKNTRSQELVIGGWLRGQGSREGTIGAILVGYHEGQDGERRLRYAGRVGSGFTEAELQRLAGLLEPLETEASPFEGRQPPKQSIFVEPRLVANIAFREWTAALTLRAPVYKGLRTDRDAAEVVLEQEEAPPKPA
jgi:bifunctional non-homologous end joining protein LigD